MKGAHPLMARVASVGQSAPVVVTAMEVGEHAVDLVQRQAVAECPPPTPPPTPVAPQADPKFTAVTKSVEAKAEKAKAHPPARAEVRRAQDAAVPPSDDKTSQAKAAQADKMAAAKPGSFDKAAFVAAVKKAIDASGPKTLDDADKFASSGKADGVKAEVMTKVSKGKEESGKDIADQTKAPPDLSVAKEKPVVPLAENKAAVPSDPKAARAMPEKASADQTNLEAGKCETDSAMAKEGVTEEQLEKSNEPQFQAAVSAKKEGEAHSATAPAEVRATEAETLQQAKASATPKGAGAIQGMGAAKTGAVSRVGSQKDATKSKDEAARAQVAADINAIYDETKTAVEKILTDLDAKVDSKFNTGEAEAKRAFTQDHTARMKAWKDKRYEGASGAIQWGIDLFKDLPPEANQIFLDAKKLYEQRMGAVINDVAELIGRELDAAKLRIDQGRAKIKAYVASKPKNLRQIAQEAAQGVEEKLEQLQSDVDSKKEQLVTDLAEKYVEAKTKVDDEVNTLQAENKGLWSKAKEAVGEAIETIKKLKDMLLGVLARAAGAIDKIIKDPIGFLGNLVNAIKAGVIGFASRIGEHLKKGLQAWLFGELAKSGIELPEKFDLKGILKLVLSLLGLTYANIRGRAVGIVGEKVVSRLEQAAEVFKILVTEGPAGLWKSVVDKIGDIKEQVMGQIREFVITKIVMAGITWIVSLLNPASAFVKACKAIYDIVMFLVNKAGQIKEFVDSVLDSVEAIAGGGAGKVAGLIEGTLAKMLPVVIGFLASLLGLGGISEKIKSVLAVTQVPVNKAIDWVIKGALKLGKKLMGAGKKLFGKIAGKFKKSPKEKTAAEGAKREAVEEVAKRAKGLDRIEMLGPVVSSVRTQFQPKGLRSLAVKADGSATSLTVVARQVEQPERRTMTWAQVFPAVDLKKLEQMMQGDLKAFEKQGRSTVAVLSVNGSPIGRVEESGEGSHAEMKVFANGWQQVLEIARPRAAREERTSVILAVNRTPCPECSRRIRAITQAARSKWPEVGPWIDFTLAATGTYEGSDPRSMEGATKAQDLAKLAGLGWDIQQLLTGAKQYEPRSVPLAEFAHSLAAKADQAGK